MCDRWCQEIAGLSVQYWPENPSVLEVGSYNINGSVRSTCQNAAASYIGVDVCAGPDVDEVVPGELLVDRFGRSVFDVVISAEMLEHVADWPIILKNMLAVLKPNGVLVITTRTPGMFKHYHPFDHWRYTLDNFNRIFSPLGEIKHIEHDVASHGICIILKKENDISVEQATELEQIPVLHVEYGEISHADFVKKPKISFVAIVKNEERTIRRCIESCRTVVDEWIIVDTGSTDNTKAIVTELTGKPPYEKVFEDFVITKNKALELAAEDYILFMDSDEYFLTNVDKLRKYANDGVDAVSGVIGEGDINKPNLTYHRFRMWKNKPTHRFAGPGVHEVIMVSGKTVYDDTIRVYHDHAHRTPESYQERNNFYVALLKSYTEKDPKDTRARFYLARTYMDMNLPLLAVEHYQTYLDMNSNYRDEQWQAAYDASRCLIGLGEYSKAQDYLVKATKIDERRSESWLLLGDLYYRRQDWESALEYYTKAASLPFPKDVILFIDQRAYADTPKEAVARCQEKLKNYKKAKDIRTELNPFFPDKQAIDKLTLLNSITCLKIFFTLGHTPEPVYGKLLEERGTGGVETSYIELPTELAKLGHQVFVFCECSEEHTYKQVRYIPYTSLRRYVDLDPDYVVTTRWSEPLFLFLKAKRIVWLQDSRFADPVYGDTWAIADKIVVSSPWHKDYTFERLQEKVDAKKLKVIPLAIHKSEFYKRFDRIKKKVVYSSNPDRGLFILKDMWPAICAAVPDISLTIAYGWEGLKTWNNNSEWQKKIENDYSIIEAWKAQYKNIKLTGRLTKRQLYAEIMSSELCLYPNNFWETFCLTGLETQAAGVPMVTSNMGALSTTLNSSCNVLIDGDPFSEQYKKRFIASAVELLTDDKKLEKMSDDCLKYVAKSPCDWSNIAEVWENLFFNLVHINGSYS